MARWGEMRQIKVLKIVVDNLNQDCYYLNMNNTEQGRNEIERKENSNLLARVLECFDGYRVECWIVNTYSNTDGQYIRTKGYKTLTGARKYAAQFVGLA